MSLDFRVDRNSPKWVLGPNGYLIQYVNDAPAIEFNADGSYKGVLVEPQSVNEAKASEDLDNGTYWGFGNTTIAGDTETDPKGGANSFLLSETVDNASHLFFAPTIQRPSVGSGETWTQSIFVKKGDGANAPDIIQLVNQNATFPATNYANFDISVGGGTSGTVTASSGGTGRIRYYGNGWYRISWASTSTFAGTATIVLGFTDNNPTATQFPSYAGQTDANVFIWGAQLEESPIATSYIPTTTGAVTRLKDDIYLTSASSLIGQTEGTLFIEVDWQKSSVIGQYILGVSDGTNNNRINIYNNNTSDELSMIARVDGNTVTNQGQTSTSYTGIQKIAFAYKTNDFELYRNGSSISTDTIGSLASLATLTDVEFGKAPLTDATSNDFQANMWIRAVALFTTRLSDPECEALTTI